MKLGDKLKQLRTERNWSQPQAADVIGIEQSYLSKLENEKSIPSTDTFKAILSAYNVTMGAFLEGLDPQVLEHQLCQIPEVATYLGATNKMKIQNIHKWLITSATACVLGLTLILSGHQGLVFANKLFFYQSPGVVLTGESKNIFQNWREPFYPSSHPSSHDPDGYKIVKKAAYEKQLEMIRRADEKFLVSGHYRGDHFTQDVAGGSRTYSFVTERNANRLVNRLLILFGALLTFGGIFGFFVEFRLRKLL